MTSQGDLFTYQPPSAAKAYPERSGAKSAGTSQAAADRIESAGRAEILRNRVLQLLQTGRQLTADEIAEALGEEFWSIRPRCTELKLKFLIIPTGERRKNKSGATAEVLCAAVIQKETLS